MRLAEGVAAGDQRHGLLVIHRHAGEGLADIARRLDRVGIAVRAFRVDVDEAHLHRAERFAELALARIALVAEPGAFRAPEQLFRLPDIGTAAGEAERFEAHRISSATLPVRTSRSAHEIGVAVFLLDRPDQAAGLVEIGVVRPAVERGETLLPLPGAAAAIGDAIGAGAVPGHADEQPAVMAEISRPPILRVGHDLDEVGLHRGEVELLELLGIVEPGTERIGERGVAMQHREIELLGPPVAIAMAPLAAAPAVVHRALARAAIVTCVHLRLRLSVAVG